MLMKALKKLAYIGRDFLVAPILHRIDSIKVSESVSHSGVSQLQLQMTYRLLKESGMALPGLSQVGFKVYSQTDEDGILHYIFSIIGTANKKSVEICAGNGVECNTANLIVNHGWHGLLVDGEEGNVKRGIEFYKTNSNTFIYPPVFVHSWITRDNVNEVIKNNGFEGEIDLLSLDMDGVDYWIWDAINIIEPRVVVLEYQNIISPDKALTVPYCDSFYAYEHSTTNGLPNFCGASLLAFVKLAKTKGYRLVGCNNLGYNAFFIKNPLSEKEIPEIDVRDCFKHPNVLWAMKERFPIVKDFPWVEV